MHQTAASFLKTHNYSAFICITATMVNFDFQNDEIVLSPTVIVSGHLLAVSRGVIQFVNNNNKVFPPQVFEVNNGYFKAILHLSPDRNEFEVTVYEGVAINEFGFADFEKTSKARDSSKLTIVYRKHENKVVHLCLIVGKDSNGGYDMPKYRLNRGERPSLDAAIRKLKVAGRLMQAFTMNEMRNTGFYNRTFQFAEETTDDQGLFGYNVKSPTPHQEVKVHVLQSDKTVAQLRDPDWAQQNKNAKNLGALFGHAIELVKRTPELWNEHERNGTAVQCACFYLDSTWDKKNNLILTHAALGGGTGEVKMAIFGSHGLHLWPATFPAVTPSFLDATHLSINEVANDCNECGTSWECLNITMGAFMHEIGHSLGCPHQENGVMLRDYVWWNRAFMTREKECLRRRSGGETIGNGGQWGANCTWHICDKMRFFYHDSFTMSPDLNDPTFAKCISTTLQPDKLYDENGYSSSPSSFSIKQNEITVNSPSGFYMIEFVTDSLARASINFLPKSFGGNGLPKLLTFTHQQLFQEFKNRRLDGREDFDIRFLSLLGDLYIDKLNEYLRNHHEEPIQGDFGLGRGVIKGYKGTVLGRENGRMIVAGFDINTLYKVRIYHGGALDGVEFFYRNGGSTQGSPPVVPPRNYLGIFGKKNAPPSGSEVNSLLGNRKSSYTDFDLAPGERVARFVLRSGAWIDALQIETSLGRKSPMLGNTGGGGVHVLEVPDNRFEIVALFGYVGDWVDGLGMVFAEKR